MRRMIKTFLCWALLAIAWQQAWGFALLGPIAGADASWQTITLGYNMAYEDTLIPGDPTWLGDIGGPRNVGEEYRRNDPVVYYAYDDNFSGFFGAKGEAACDQAFEVMNSFFTNHINGVDGYTTNLSEFPFNSEYFNGTAQGYYLTDIKSVMLHLLVEQMGLAEPERYTWTLRQRFQGASPPPCPENISYVVIQRNYGTFDQPLTGPQTGTIYSPYVDNLLYTYGILEDCGHHPPAYTAITVPFSVDTTVPEYTAVAANNYEGGAESGLGGLEIGGYYTGLTEDDAAGLRYLLSSNTIVYEIPAAGSQLEATNFANIIPLVTSDLSALMEFAQTNPPAAVQLAFPTLQIASSTNYLVLTTNGYVENWAYTFGNIVILNQFSNVVEQMQTVSLQPQYGAPAGTPPATNISYQTITLTNISGGNYFIIPPGSCGVDIIATNPPVAVYTTNFVGASTNSFGPVTTNIVTVFTNETIYYYGCNFQPVTATNYEGIQKVQFVRVSDGDLDPITDAFYIPVTNTYSMTAVNLLTGQAQPQTLQRIVTVPDFLVTASDQVAANTFVGTVTRTINFEEGQIQPGLSGPGTIDGQSVINFDKVGTAWWNGPFPDTNSFLIGPDSEVNQTTGIPSLLWGSFDGTTNTPTVYPTGLSIQQLENQMIVSISPTGLPSGTNGMAFTPTTFTATGGTQPYTWSATGLPAGLAIFGNVLQGTPNGNTAGVYDVTVTLQDSSLPAIIVTRNYTITIN
jgi:hypothetical protein